ncbi:hypothetical protein LJR225_000019 [Phenylobacterium sp. LjRoot225]|uniref:hypothetical protein n=1 Tax=Phenylobacterium sp. LjRoot225 TaxID=3342285 RepID=UPI003ECF4E7C
MTASPASNQARERRFTLAAFATGLALAWAAPSIAEVATLNPAPTAADWAAIARLPDWSGVWSPSPLVSGGPGFTDPPAWTPKAAARVARMRAAEAAGRPQNIYIDCLPEGMPSFNLMTLNATEFLFTPGRVTVLNEFDGNRLRRIWTDGRPHPVDPDPTFNGHSIGRWDGDTLVVDTVAIHPETFIPLGQAIGVPNNGDAHVVERIRLTGPDTLEIVTEISAPHVLTKPWRTTRTWTRKRDRRFDIVEASCRQGDFLEDADADGFAVFIPIPKDEGGAPLPPSPPNDKK